MEDSPELVECANCGIGKVNPEGGDCCICRFCGQERAKELGAGFDELMHLQVDLIDLQNF
jgi:hypothetical protein